MSMPFDTKIEHLISAGFQSIMVPTTERARCEMELERLAQRMRFDDEQCGFYTWDAVDGFKRGALAAQDAQGRIEPVPQLLARPDVRDPVEALMTIDPNKYPQESSGVEKHFIVVFRNLHTYLDDPVVRQAFQNLCYDQRLNTADYKRPVILQSAGLRLNDEALPCVTITEFTLPDEAQLLAIVMNLCSNIDVQSAKDKVNTTFSEEISDKIVQALRGLTSLEAENVLAYALRVNRGFNPALIETIEDQKAAVLAKSEILTYIPKERILTMDDIAGYDVMKDFIRKRRVAYNKKARELKLDLPRGVVLLGIPGTGKSTVGRIIARELELPLVILDVSAVYNSLVGASEQRIRDALKTVDAFDGSVLFIDEADKGLGGTSESVGDSGVSRRVFGTLLTWLTEKKSRTFVVLTMNRTRGIPSEFLRKGRFDEIFFTDVPTPLERDEILKIHFRKRGVDPTVYKPAEWNSLLEKTNQLVGSELEQVVADARLAAYVERGEGVPTIDELLHAAQMIPLAEAEADNIEEIRRLGKSRAKPVSKGVRPAAPPRKTSRSVNL